MRRVLYERDGRIARITLNRPEVLNAIDAELPGELEAAVARANGDPGGWAFLLPVALVLPNFLYAAYLLRNVRNDTRLSTDLSNDRISTGAASSA